jgi:hypothetical protein
VGSAGVVGRDGQHLKLRLLDDDGAALDAIGFRLAPTHAALARPGAVLDVAAQLQEDSWRGRSRIQAKLVDLRAAV